MTRVQVKIAIAAAVVLGILAGSTLAVQASSSKFADEPLEEASPAVEKMVASSVTVLKNKYGIGLPGPTKDVIGAGVIIQSTPGKPILVLTVSHVANAIRDGGGYIRVKGPGGKSLTYTVKPIAVEVELDLALLAADNAWDGPDISAKLALQSPKRGDQIWIVGAPSGNEHNITSGIISNKTPCSNSAGSCYRTDAILYFGNSGGGVFDITGALVGIADYVKIEQIHDKNDDVHYVIIPGAGGVLSWNTVGRFLESQHLLPTK